MKQVVNIFFGISLLACAFCVLASVVLAPVWLLFASLLSVFAISTSALFMFHLESKDHAAQSP